MGLVEAAQLLNSLQHLLRQLQVTGRLSSVRVLVVLRRVPLDDVERRILAAM